MIHQCIFIHITVGLWKAHMMVKGTGYVVGMTSFTNTLPYLFFPENEYSLGYTDRHFPLATPVRAQFVPHINTHQLALQVS